MLAQLGFEGFNIKMLIEKTVFMHGFEKVLLALHWIFCAYLSCPLWVGKLAYWDSLTVKVALSIHWDSAVSRLKQH